MDQFNEAPLEFNLSLFPDHPEILPLARVNQRQQQPQLTMTHADQTTTNKRQRSECGPKEQSEVMCSQCCRWTDKEAEEFSADRWIKDHKFLFGQVCNNDEHVCVQVGGISQNSKMAYHPSHWHPEFVDGHYWVYPATASRGKIIRKAGDSPLDAACFEIAKSIQPDTIPDPPNLPGKNPKSNAIPCCRIKFFLHFYLSGEKNKVFLQKYYPKKTPNPVAIDEFLKARQLPPYDPMEAGKRLKADDDDGEDVDVHALLLLVQSIVKGGQTISDDNWTALKRFGDVAYMMRKQSEEEIFSVGQIIAVVVSKHGLVVTGHPQPQQQQPHFWGVVANCEFMRDHREDWPRPDLSKGDLKDPLNLSSSELGVPVVVTGIAAVRINGITGALVPGSVVVVGDNLSNKGEIVTRCVSPRDITKAKASRTVGTISECDIDGGIALIRINMGDTTKTLLDGLLTELAMMKKGQRELAQRIEVVAKNVTRVTGNGKKRMLDGFVRDQLIPKYLSQTVQIVGWHGESPLLQNVYQPLETRNRSGMKTRPMDALHGHRSLSHVVVSGRSGVGKSTLCHRLCYEWAHEPGDFLLCVLFVPIDHLFGCPVVTLETILSRVYNISQSDVQQLTNELTQVPSRVLFIFDGIDTPGVQKETSLVCFISALLRRQVHWVKRALFTSREPLDELCQDAVFWRLKGFSETSAMAFVNAYPAFRGRSAKDLGLLAAIGQLSSPFLCGVACAAAVNSEGEAPITPAIFLNRFYRESTQDVDKLMLRLFLDLCLWSRCCGDYLDISFTPKEDAVQAVEWLGMKKFRALAGAKADPRFWDAARDTSFFWHSNDVKWAAHFCQRVKFAHEFAEAEFCDTFVNTGLVCRSVEDKQRLWVPENVSDVLWVQALVAASADPPQAPTSLMSLVQRSVPNVLCDLVDHPRIDLKTLLMYRIPQSLRELIGTRMPSLEEPDFEDWCLALGPSVFELKYNVLSHRALAQALLNVGLVSNKVTWIDAAVRKGATKPEQDVFLTAFVSTSNSLPILERFYQLGWIKGDEFLDVSLLSLACAQGREEEISFYTSHFPAYIASVFESFLECLFSIVSEALTAAQDNMERMVQVLKDSSEAPSIEPFVLNIEKGKMLSCVNILSRCAFQGKWKARSAFFLIALGMDIHPIPRSLLVSAVSSDIDEVAFKSIIDDGACLEHHEDLLYIASVCGQDKLCLLLEAFHDKMEEAVLWVLSSICCTRKFDRAYRIIANADKSANTFLSALSCCEKQLMEWNLDILSVNEALAISGCWILGARDDGRELLQPFFDACPQTQLLKQSIAICSSDAAWFDFAVERGLVPDGPGFFDMCVSKGRLYAAKETLDRWPDLCELSSQNVGVAVQNLDLAMLELLLKRGASPNPSPPGNQQKQRGMTRTFLWAATRSLPVLRLLVDYGADVRGAKGPNAGETLIHFSEAPCRIEVFKFLVEECRLDAAKSLRSGLNILHVATTAEVVRFAVKHGANVNQRVDFVLSPLLFAIMAGNVEVVRALVEMGADISSSMLAGLSAGGMSVAMRRLDIERYLRGRGYERSQSDLLFSVAFNTKFLDEALSSLVENRSVSGPPVPSIHPDFEEAIRQGDIDANYTFSTSGNSLLHMSISMGNIECTKLLLEVKANPSFTNSEGLSALHVALEECKAEAIEAILQSPFVSSVVNLTNEQVDPPLMTAISAPTTSTETIVQLVKARADVNGGSKIGETPLMRAATLGDIVSLVALMQLGADSRLADSEGRTAAVYAASDEVLTALSSFTQ